MAGRVMCPAEHMHACRQQTRAASEPVAQPQHESPATGPPGVTPKKCGRAYDRSPSTVTRTGAAPDGDQVTYLDDPGAVQSQVTCFWCELSNVTRHHRCARALR